MIVEPSTIKLCFVARELKDRSDVQMFNLISGIEPLSRQRIERALPHGLSAASFAVLGHFARRGEVGAPAELAAAMGVTKGAMTNTLQRLEGLGFVVVADDPADGRRKRVTLTDLGARAHRDCLMALRPDMEALRAAFGEEEFARSLPFLARLRAWLEANR